ncbi:Ni/Fe-hydrogenase, b-type cytochrome subunit [Geomonas sp. Red276]
MVDRIARYVWEVPVRASHWVNAVAIVLLSVTGIYIGSPRSLGLTTSDYVMGWVRFVHFVAAYCFTVSVAARFYWAFVGNKYASWRVFFPLYTKEGRKGVMDTFRYYTFTKHSIPPLVGHNPLAGSMYGLVFLLYVIMILTGFALYSEHAPGGLLYKLFGWEFSIFRNQQLRLAHHLIMWFFCAFSINHIYSAWLMDAKEHGGVISSIFSGYQIGHKEGES